MISPTSRRRATSSGAHRCSRVTVANEITPTTRSSTTIGASAQETTPYRARVAAVARGLGRQLIESRRGPRAPAPRNSRANHPRERILWIGHRRADRAHPYPEVSPRHRLLGQIVVDHACPVGPEQLADGTERLDDLGVDGLDRHAEQARREPGDTLVEVDGASERVVALHPCECAPDDLGNPPQLVDHRGRPGPAVTDRAEHEPADRRPAGEQRQAGERPDPTPLEELPVASPPAPGGRRASPGRPGPRCRGGPRSTGAGPPGRTGPAARTQAGPSGGRSEAGHRRGAVGPVRRDRHRRNRRPGRRSSSS